MCGVVEMTNFLLMLVAVDILVSVELWVSILAKGLRHHFWSGWFLAEFQEFCFSAARRFLFCLLLAWVEITAGAVMLAWNKCSVSYFCEQKENLLLKSSLLFNAKVYSYLLAKKLSSLGAEKNTSLFEWDVKLLMLTKALHMEVFNLLHSFPPVSCLFEGDEVNPMSQVGAAADPR